jgi:hypothetical protein
MFTLVGQTYARQKPTVNSRILFKWSFIWLILVWPFKRCFPHTASAYINALHVIYFDLKLSQKHNKKLEKSTQFPQITYRKEKENKYFIHHFAVSTLKSSPVMVVLSKKSTIKNIVESCRSWTHEQNGLWDDLKLATPF